MDVTLEDAEGLLLDASLNKLLAGVPKMMREYMNAEIEGETFEVDATKAKCFVKDKKGNAQKVACTKLAALVGDAADGLHAVILGKPKRPAEGEEGAEETMSFSAKKVVASV